MENYILPKYESRQFTCPHCNAITPQTWGNFYIDMDYTDGYMDKSLFVNMIDVGFNEDNNCWDDGHLTVSLCSHCGDFSIWIEKQMIYPQVSIIPSCPNSVSDQFRKLYDEARNLYNYSPRASAALLRLATEELCLHLNIKGEKLDDKIRNLKKDKNMRPTTKDALDSLRLMGNRAIHPGIININEDPEITLLLFDALRLVINDLIIEPSKMKKLNNKRKQ